MKANLYVRGKNFKIKNPQNSNERLCFVLYKDFFSYQNPNNEEFYPHSIDYSRFFIRYYKTKLILDFYRGDL